MSSSFQEERAEAIGKLARELRQFNGLGASFFRAAAAQIGMTITDMQVIDILDSTGPSTAGQLADLTGLTTGAITGMLKRLEEAGFVSRERDPEDGRRVIVRLIPGNDNSREIGPIFASLGKAWDEMAARYDDEQIAFLLEFLKHSNELSRKEIIRLRETPADEEEIFSAPLGELESARLVFSSGITGLILRADSGMADLYRARFEGPVPGVKAKDGVITIRYPRHLGIVDWRNRVAEVSLNTAIPWQIMIQGGAAEITGELSALNLAGLEVKGGLSTLHLELSVPSGIVPIRISGGSSEVTIQRPEGVAARAHLKGWVSSFVFDDQTLNYAGNNIRLQSAGYEATAPYYDFEIIGSASAVTINTIRAKVSN